jgi:2-methylisocitrate lyase-like PEP mutase family enzyme
VKGELSQELPNPEHFEQAAQMITADDVAQSVVCGPDPGPVIEQIDAYAEAGYDHVYIHQIGRDQEGFFRFAEREILPRYAS